MALRQIMITKKIREKNELLKQIREAAAGFEQREKELEQAIEEAKTEEETTTVEDSVQEFEKEKEKNEEDAKKLEQEIKDLEQELEQERSKIESPVKENREKPKQKEERTIMVSRNGVFGNMAPEERSRFLKNEDVKGFLERTKEILGGQTRALGAVQNVDLTIPDVVLELLRDNIDRYSKLIGKVRLRRLKGKARQNIAGTIPEAVWTEAIGKLNQLKVSFNQIEMDGYKVGGFIPIENSYLEDSDENLAEYILDSLGQAIGLAIDKAILYGTGTKMPMGIVTRLAQTAKPSDHSENDREWKDLHTSNVLKFDLASASGTKFWEAIVNASGAAKENFSNGEKFWIMNSTTKTTFLSKAIAFNAAGSVVANMNSQMPIIGGEIITLPFIPDGDVIGGYEKLYTLVERKGGTFAKSDQVMFIEDATVFKGTARYDGRPVIEEGFMAMNIKNVAVTTSMSFVEDTANAVEAE